MPRDTRTYHVGHSDNVTLTGHWSRTYDVLAIVGEEEDASVEAIASFDNVANAEAFVTDTKDSRYIVGVRPPSHVITQAVKWLAIVASQTLESLPSGNGGPC